MATKPKGKTYGRKKGNDFVGRFAALRLSPASEESIPRVSPRRVFKELHVNQVSTVRIQSAARTFEVSPPKRDAASQTARSKPEIGNSCLVEQESRTAGSNVDRFVKPRRSPRKGVHHLDLGLDSDLQKLLSLSFIHHSILNFSQQCLRWSKTLSFDKIAQGSFASIFRLSLRSDPTIYSIWKLMPLRPKAGKGSRLSAATTYEDAAAELRLLDTMSKSPGFVEFRGARILKGVLPAALSRAADAWYAKLKDRERAELGEQIVYDKDQLWLLIEMTDAGKDLESHLASNAISVREAHDIFWAVAETLAHGEIHAEFEHRDLHPGNVCIKVQPRQSRSGLLPRLTSLEITLIDYTLSRAVVPGHAVMANSMRDNAIFQQHSDDVTDESQFETYRGMQTVMHWLHKGKQRRTGWQSFMPMTNVLWLHHLLALLLRRVKRAKATHDCYKRLCEVQIALDPTKMQQWQYKSATELVGNEVERLEQERLCKSLERTIL